LVIWYKSSIFADEFKEEAIVRKLDSFQRFLEAAALTSGEIVNYSNIASDCGVKSNTVKAYLDYQHSTKQMSYWHTYDGKEIDIVLGEAEVGIEIKSTDEIKPKHLSNFKPFKEEFPTCKCIAVSRDFLSRQSGDIRLMYYKDFLAALWKGDII